jgi:hypothetical protein
MPGDLVSLGLLLPSNISTSLLTECPVSRPGQLGQQGEEEAQCQPSGCC